MAHNKLRRQLQGLLKTDNCDLDPYWVKLALKRALDALGGPVGDSREAVTRGPMLPPADAPNWGLYQALDGTPPRDEAPGLGDAPEVKHLFGIPEVGAFIPPPGRLDLTDPDPTTVVTRPGPFGCVCYPWDGVHAVGCPYNPHKTDK